MHPSPRPARSKAGVSGPVASTFDKLAFLAADTTEAKAARDGLIARYGEVSLDEADAIVALGGDGLMLQTLHAFMGRRIPIFGMNRGSVGFLMNEFREGDLRERLRNATSSVVHPLALRAVDSQGREHESRAINEVSLLRQTNQVAKLRISINGKERLGELMADGLLVATPAGSTAYNLSADGPILPLDAPLMALTPISAFRPRRWRGALLPDRAVVGIEILEADKRPVSVVADHAEFRRVVQVSIAMDHAIGLVLLHDPDHSLEERILREQFGY